MRPGGGGPDVGLQVTVLCLCCACAVPVLCLCCACAAPVLEPVLWMWCACNVV